MNWEKKQEKVFTNTDTTGDFSEELDTFLNHEVIKPYNKLAMLYREITQNVAFKVYERFLLSKYFKILKAASFN